MAERPTIDEQKLFYDRWNVQHRGGSFDQIPEEIRERGRRVLEILGGLGLSQPRILEVGCGTGWLTERLCPLGRITAIDLSPEAIEVARRRGIPAELIAGDFFQQRFDSAPYDVVVCIETLFYVEDQPGFVAKLAELLAPQGYLIVTTINKFVYERSQDVRPVERGQVRNWLSRRQVQQLLARFVDVQSVTTVAPKGERGILRVVNAPKVDAVLARLLTAQRVRAIKERAGLGSGVIVIGRKRRV